MRWRRAVLFSHLVRPGVIGVVAVVGPHHLQLLFCQFIIPAASVVYCFCKGYCISCNTQIMWSMHGDIDLASRSGLHHSLSQRMISLHSRMGCTRYVDRSFLTSDSCVQAVPKRIKNCLESCVGYRNASVHEQQDAARYAQQRGMFVNVRTYQHLKP